MATTTADRARDYLKFRAVSSKKERVAVWILVPVVLAIVLMFWGIPPLNIVPVWGPSMQPTLAVWNIPEPWARFSFSGWVHYDPSQKPELGSIVYFRIPNTRIREVKRVAKESAEGKLWVLPDNPGVSGEGSDNSDLYDWIEPEWIIGVVDKMFTPSRAVRWFTPEGRFRNDNDLYIGNLFDVAEISGVRYLTKQHGEGWYAFRGGECIQSGEGFVASLGDVVLISEVLRNSTVGSSQPLKVCESTPQGLKHLRTYYADAGETYQRSNYLFFGSKGRWWVLYPSGLAVATNRNWSPGEILEDSYPGDSWKELITGPG